MSKSGSKPTPNSEPKAPSRASARQSTIKSTASSKQKAEERKKNKVKGKEDVEHGHEDAVAVDAEQRDGLQVQSKPPFSAASSSSSSSSSSSDDDDPRGKGRQPRRAKGMRKRADRDTERDEREGETKARAKSGSGAKRKVEKGVSAGKTARETNKSAKEKAKAKVKQEDDGDNGDNKTIEEARPSQARPSQAKPSQAKPSQAKPSQAKPSQAKPSRAKPPQALVKAGESSDTDMVDAEQAAPELGSREKMRGTSSGIKASNRQDYDDDDENGGDDDDGIEAGSEAGSETDGESELEDEDEDEVDDEDQYEDDLESEYGQENEHQEDGDQKESNTLVSFRARGSRHLQLFNTKLGQDIMFVPDDDDENDDGGQTPSTRDLKEILSNFHSSGSSSNTRKPSSKDLEAAARLALRPIEEKLELIAYVPWDYENRNFPGAWWYCVRHVDFTKQNKTWNETGREKRLVDALREKFNGFIIYPRTLSPEADRMKVSKMKKDWDSTKGRKSRARAIESALADIGLEDQVEGVTLTGKDEDEIYLPDEQNFVATAKHRPARSTRAKQARNTTAPKRAESRYFGDVPPRRNLTFAVKEADEMRGRRYRDMEGEYRTDDASDNSRNSRGTKRHRRNAAERGSVRRQRFENQHDTFSQPEDSEPEESREHLLSQMEKLMARIRSLRKDSEGTMDNPTIGFLYHSMAKQMASVGSKDFTTASLSHILRKMTRDFDVAEGIVSERYNKMNRDQHGPTKGKDQIAYGEKERKQKSNRLDNKIGQQDRAKSRVGWTR